MDYLNNYFAIPLIVNNIPPFFHEGDGAGPTLRLPSQGSNPLKTDTKVGFPSGKSYSGMSFPWGNSNCMARFPRESLHRVVFRGGESLSTRPVLCIITCRGGEGTVRDKSTLSTINCFNASSSCFFFLNK